MALVNGLGRLHLEALDLPEPKYIHVEPIEFSLDGEAQEVESEKYVDFEKVIAGARRSGRKFTLSMNIQAVTWPTLQLALGEIAGVTPNIALPEIRYGNIPPGAPYEVSNSEITTIDVQATVVTEGDEIMLDKASGTPNAGQFEVDVGSPPGKLIFNSAQAGKRVAYRIFKPYTNLESIGEEEAYQILTNFGFTGTVWSDSRYYRIVIPRLQMSNVPSLNIGEVTTLELTFKLINIGNSRLPFKVFKMPADYNPTAA
ncbi:MAG: hypothetical protein AAGF24_03245 [Cyanobacteria bacterium P01_H01_bin.121]